MLSHELVIDGTAYIHSREAARVVGLSSDYLTKLGRGSVIDDKSPASPTSKKKFSAARARERRFI